MRNESDILGGAAFDGEVGGGAAFVPRGPAAAYHAGDLLTATPRRLAELLCQGAVGLCEQAVEAMDVGDADRAADCLGRARGMLRQLQNALAPLAAPAARELWDFCQDVQQRLIEADYYRRREGVAETLCLLAGRRPDWIELARRAWGQTPGGRLPARRPADPASVPVSSGGASGWIG